MLQFNIYATCENLILRTLLYIITILLYHYIIIYYCYIIKIIYVHIIINRARGSLTGLKQTQAI